MPSLPEVLCKGVHIYSYTRRTRTVLSSDNPSIRISHGRSIDAPVITRVLGTLILKSIAPARHTSRGRPTVAPASEESVTFSFFIYPLPPPENLCRIYMYIVRRYGCRSETRRYCSVYTVCVCVVLHARGKDFGKT